MIIDTFSIVADVKASNRFSPIEIPEMKDSWSSLNSCLLENRTLGALRYL